MRSFMPLVVLAVLCSTASSQHYVPAGHVILNGENKNNTVVRKKSIIEENAVYTYDFETKQEALFTESEIYYAQGVSGEGYLPPETFGVQGSPEAYFKMPFRATCAMFVTYDRNGDGTGDTTFTRTAALVGKDVALTACEATIHPTMGYPVSIVVAPGMYHTAGGNPVQPFGEARVTSLSRGNFPSTKHANDNWAILYLSSDIGLQAGWFGVSDTGVENEGLVNACGEADSNDLTTETLYGNVVDVSTYSFIYKTFSSPKDSLIGAPVYKPGEYPTYSIRGIHTSEYSLSGKYYHYSACKISVYIENWLQDRGGQVRVSLFSRYGDSEPSKKGRLGHAWITVENLSKDYAIHGGKMPLNPGEAVSLGTWPVSGRYGLWYNLEHRHSLDYPQRYDSRVSISKLCFIAQWRDANEIVMGADWWMPIDNCVKFAVEAWNATFPFETFDKGTIPFPEVLRNQLLAVPGHKIMADVPGGSNSGYYDGDTFVAKYVEA